MDFHVVSSPVDQRALSGSVYLVQDRWNDFGIRTQFFMTYCDTKGELHEIGSVKIALNTVPQNNQGYVDIVPRKFTSLEKGFFSLGQGDEYYEALKKLGDTIRKQILTALRFFDVHYGI